MDCVRVAYLALLCCLLSSSIVRAEPTPASADSAGEPAAYRAAIDTAIEEFSAENYTEAREHFMRAHSIYPNARTLRGLGMTEFVLRNYVEAVDKLELALASPAKRLDGKLQQETLELLGRAKAYVGEVVLDVTPATAEVRVDGIPATPTAARRLRLEVGDHVLDFAAEGRLSERRAITVRGEQSVTLEVKLAEVALGGSNSPLQGGTREDKGANGSVPVYKRWWLWTAVGAVVVGGIAAGVIVGTRSTHVGDVYGGSTGDTLYY